MSPSKTSNVKPKKMSKKVATKTLNFLKIIHKLKPADFSTLSTYLSDEGTEQLAQCFKNALYSEDIPDKIRNKLKKALWNQKNDVRYIAKKTNSVKVKRLKLPKLGGSISLIIAAVLPILMNILTKAFSKK